MTRRAMPAGELTTCRSCGAPIFWAIADAKRKPINAEPSADGNVRVAPDRRRCVTHPRIEAENLRGKGWRLHTNHFATCPQARQWAEQVAAREGRKG